MHTIQYLEGSSEWSNVTTKQVRQKLLDAYSIVPFERVLVGWNLRRELLDVCRETCDGLGVPMLLWHPLLTGDGQLKVDPSWRVVGVSGAPVSSYQDMIEFAFLCPNQTAVQDAVLRHLDVVLETGHFDGVFLDRMRFPSPAKNLQRELGCFCEACQVQALQEGLDWNKLQAYVQSVSGSSPGLLLQDTMFDFLEEEQPRSPDEILLHQYLSFRCRSISRLIKEVVEKLHGMDLEVGLDCFSPILTRLVGQDLTTLGGYADWVKVMTYGHVYAPAGIPGELLALLDSMGGELQGAWRLMEKSLGFASLLDVKTMREYGVSPAVLLEEAFRAKSAMGGKVFAGIELVALEGVTKLSKKQIQSDTQAFRNAGADGLSLSWDLWHIPLEHLEWVAEVW